MPSQVKKCLHHRLEDCSKCFPTNKPETEHKAQLYVGAAEKRTVLRIAFDVDGTLIKMGAYGDVPRFEIVAMAKTFIELGHTVFIWSGGGKDHAENWAKKLGLWPEARVIEKRGDAFDIDIAFDDMACSLAKVDVIV